MKFTVASVVAALAATASAIPAFTNSAFDLVPGSTFTLTWANATGPVTIVLATGPATNLKKVETLSSDNSADSFTWDVPTTLVSGNYAFEITDETGTNYSKMFALTGTGTASSTAASVASSTTSASSSSTTEASTTSMESMSSTMTTSTKTSTSTTSSATATATSTTVPANTNNGPQAKSPLAFVLVTVAALLYFN